MSTKKNWYPVDSDKLKVEGRYDGPALTLESSINNEVFLTLEHTDLDDACGYFNVLDLLEMIIDRGMIANPAGIQALLIKETIDYNSQTVHNSVDNEKERQ